MRCDGWGWRMGYPIDKYPVVPMSKYPIDNFTAIMYCVNYYGASYFRPRYILEVSQTGSVLKT